MDVVVQQKMYFKNSVSPPSPSINVNTNLNVASGRAAKVLRQIKFVKGISFIKINIFF